MLRTFCLSIALGLLAVNPGLADLITNVSVNGSISGSGVVTTGVPSTGEKTHPFSFSGTNTQLGGISRTGGFGDSGAEADQSATATASSLAISMDGMVFVSQDQGPVPHFSAGVNNSISLTFTLTVESLMRLSSMFFSELPSGSDSGSLLDSMGNVILALPFNNLPFPTALEPGTYTFEEALTGFTEIDFPRSEFISEAQLFDLRAQFAAVPEPRWAWVAPMGLLILGYCRRRKIA